MTSRERIQAVCRHEPHDRVPIDLGGTFATTFTAPAYDAIRAELELPRNPGRIVSTQMMLTELDASLRKALGVDTIGIYFDGGFVHGWRPWTMPRGTRVLMPSDLDIRQREDQGWDLIRSGQQVGIMPPDGFYFDAAEFPKWRDYDPSDLTDDVLRDIGERARHCSETTDLSVVLNVPYTIFNGTSPDFLCALMIEKDEIHERLDIWTKHVIECLRLLLDALGDSVSIMAFSGDAGTQRGPIIGPELYREMILPHFRRIPEYLHTHSEIKFFYHTCGSVFELIDCFIELGVDILNPLQVTAANMAAECLAPEFGERIVMWGGGIDAQHTLTYGTEHEVRETVRHQLTHYAARPGYVFAFDHNIQPDIPPRNLLAALEEVRQWPRNSCHREVESAL